MWKIYSGNLQVVIYAKPDKDIRINAYILFSARITDFSRNKPHAAYTRSSVIPRGHDVKLVK